MTAGVRIESDGTAEGTHVYLDGVEFKDVTSVNWHFSPAQRLTTVTLEISSNTHERESQK